jgi:hypothetical protein
MKVFHCRWGVNVVGVTDAELVANVNAHIAAGQELAREYTTEQILELAHEH